MKNAKPRYLMINRHAQQGTAALLISLVILTLITFVSLYTSKTVVVEQQIAANEYRSRVAFEAAEAGREAALAYAELDPDRDNDGDLTDELIFDSSTPALVELSATTGTTNTKTFTNNSRAIVKLDGTTTAIQITSLGISGDGSATRTINDVIEAYNPLPNFPAQPYTARGTVTVSGAASVYNPEGRTTVLTGGDFDLGSSMGAATHIADKNHANDPICLGGSSECADNTGLEGCDVTPDTNRVKCDVVESSNAAISGIDIIEHDGNLTNLDSSEFFFNFFGLEKSAFKDRMAPRIVAGADFANDYDAASNAGVHGAYAEVIWVDGDVNSNTIVAGCNFDNGLQPNGKTDVFDESCEMRHANNRLAPVIIIVDGDLELAAGTQIFGLVYVTGSIITHGTPEFQGAVVQEDLTAAVTGSLSVWYDSGILEMTAENGPLGGAAGAWKDF